MTQRTQQEPPAPPQALPQAEAVANLVVEQLQQSGLVQPPDRIVRRDEEVDEITGIGRSNRYVLEAKGLFPRRVELWPGSKLKGWRLSDLQEWVKTRRPARPAA